MNPAQYEPGNTWHPTAWGRDELAPYLDTVGEVWCGDHGPIREEGGWEFYDLPNFLNVPATKQTFSTPDAANVALAWVVAQSLRSSLFGD